MLMDWDMTVDMVLERETVVAELMAVAVLMAAMAAMTAVVSRAEQRIATFLIHQH